VIFKHSSICFLLALFSLDESLPLKIKIFVMKKTIPFSAILLISVFGYGQSYESAVQYQNKLHSAAVIELPYPLPVIEKKIADNKNDQQQQLKEIGDQNKN